MTKLLDLCLTKKFWGKMVPFSHLNSTEACLFTLAQENCGFPMATPQGDWFFASEHF